MKIYLVYCSSNDNDFLEFKSNLLFTYFTSPKKELLSKFHDNGNSIFLDSGAFSAYTQKESINLDKYIGYIKKNEDLFTVYAALDVLFNPEETKKNFIKMKQSGLTPLATFHKGTDLSYLDYYLDNADYLALGGMVAKPGLVSDNMSWLDRIWCHILKSTNPDIKIHGFGLTAQQYLESYPWYSVDSSAWLGGGRFARVKFPFGVYYFGDDVDANKQFKNLPEWEQNHIVDHLKQFGLTIEDLQKSYMARNKANIFYYTNCAIESIGREQIKAKFLDKPEQLFFA